MKLLPRPSSRAENRAGTWALVPSSDGGPSERRLSTAEWGLERDGDVVDLPMARYLRVVPREDLRRESRRAGLRLAAESPARPESRCRRLEAEAMTLLPERDWTRGAGTTCASDGCTDSRSGPAPLRSRHRWPNPFHITSLGP